MFQIDSPLSRLCLMILPIFVAACAHNPPDDPYDPIEPVNRGIYQFNDVVDTYALRPVAVGYTKITPDPVERGVSNFFSNLFYPRTIVNNYLQGKFARGTSDVGRFLVNTTVGVVGIFDVARGLGLEEHNEDFGQTLGWWGLNQGPYLMLPLFGPSTGKDLTGRIVDIPLNPIYYLDDDAALALYILSTIDLRAQLLDLDKQIDNAFDPYAFIRSAYLESRLSETYDGDPPRSLYSQPPEAGAADDDNP